ncbi:FtsX-like permease family protein [Paenibacillus lentus]|uniref:FtsX-like permease family protein n=1 Tax=Paenibacillus lentus TaxID=1338368 RepID=UPI00365BF0D7
MTLRKKALWRDIFREIWQTKARFLSIFAIIMLGVGFFAGIKATGPDMLDTANHYFKRLQLMDLKVQSTYGLTEEDLEVLQEQPGVRVVQPGYSEDVFLGESGLIAKVFSYSKDHALNDYKVVEGKLPEASGEIAIDDHQAVTNAFGLGDTITFTNPDPDVKLEDSFQRVSYTVVGLVKSPQYIEKGGRGTSRIGKGTADAFVVIPQEDFSLPVYTEAYIGFEDTAGITTYTPEYETRVEQHKSAVEQALSSRPEQRLEEVRAEGQEKLDDAERQIEEGKTKLADAETKLADAKEKLDEGRKSYEEGASKLERELAKGQAQLDKAAKELAAGKAELAKNRTALSEGETQFKAGQAKLDAERASAAPRLEQGRQLVQSLNQTASVAPDALSEAQKQQAVAAAKGADAQFGAAAEGYVGGSIDSVAFKQAIAGFEQGLTQAAAQLEQAQQELDRRAQELAAGKQQLAAAERKLTQGEGELAAGKTKLAESREEGEAQLAEAKRELEEGQAEYDKGLAEYKAEKAKAERDIADAEKKLTEGQEQIDELKLPKYFVLDRSSNPGYAEYSDNADRLNAIATAFPVFFFLIAALVSLTTMTRMVEEQRLQIGTLKALGYKNADIMAKFLVYGTLASLAASAAGLAIGFTLLPKIIYNAYGTLYNLPDLRISFYPSYSLISAIVALLCTTVTAVIATRVELRSSASVLMRPKAPKSGQRILLERITFIWKQLGFIGKVTARNLFRYKQRMFMTVFGVAGCTALILTGFGLKDSIGDIAGLQYKEIMKYNAIIAFNEDSDAAEQQQEEYEALLASTPEITGALNVIQDTMTAAAKGVNNQDVTVFAPETMEKLDRFVVLKDRKTGERRELTNQGVIVTEKLAKLYSLSPGDSLTLQNKDNEPFEVQVAGVTENYAMHYIYMTPAYYEGIFGKEPEYNTQLLLSSDTSKDWEDRFGEKLTPLERVALVKFSSGVGDVFTDTLKSMDVVVVVLIISAAALAFVVLYNLTNINVSERIRELSTIKVLGFYDKEVTMYIYRENLLLSFLGILVGNFLGIWLHSFVLQTAEIDIMMFSPTIKWLSYGYASVLTLLFSGIVMLFMHYKLKHIDMIEALKSVE